MNNISKEKAREISEAQVPLRIRDHRLRVDRIKRNAQRRKVHALKPRLSKLDFLAIPLVDHALNTGEGPASGLFAPEIHRLRGMFLKSLGSPAEEIECALRTALEIAEEQGAFLLKLRASTSLARLWRDQGKVQQARELLAPVYGWFTEGFETRDLKEAKTLLEELAA